ncbi:GDNF-inducible zinc finger protein 1-like [Armigeres subalbatus]|uniref:GDNF-inducible zinc finger protein 1-like n=1 Tax=Armigeres subalbatus TaxID=124917 RepID=UPI002ED47513
MIMATKIVQNEAASVNKARHLICRLCMSKKSLKNIFQHDGLSIWISKFLSIVVSRDDKISLMVCDDCRTRLFDFREYQLRCMEVQNELEVECTDEEIIGSKRSTSIVTKKKLRQDSEIVFNCSKCEKNFRSQRGFELHNETFHSTVVFQCEFCSLMFPAKHLLRKHTKKHFERGRKHSCAICGFAFLELNHLKRHMEKHKRENLKIDHRICQIQDRQKINDPVNDREINYDQSEKSILESSDNVNVEPGADDLFEATSIKIELEVDDSNEERKQERINEHVTEVSLEAETSASSEAPKFKCDICHKYLKTKQVLTVHKQNVHSPKILNCPKCYKSFSSRTSFRRHERVVHNKERMHKCEVCCYEFFTKYDMNKHMKVHQEGYMRSYGRKGKPSLTDEDVERVNTETENSESVPELMDIKKEV